MVSASGLLWPESPESAARASLRNALAVLRRAIDDQKAEPPLLAITRHTITFQPTDDCQFDFAGFERVLSASADEGIQAESLAEILAETLSIFRGGFSAEAALAVANASLHDLRGLAAKSCLQVCTINGVGRYQIHEYLRQYGFEQLQEMADSAAEVAARGGHAAYFLAELRDAEVGMKGDGQTEVIDSLVLDDENIRAAWRWAAERRQFEALSHAIEPLCRFYEWQGLHEKNLPTRRHAASGGQGLTIWAFWHRSTCTWVS